MNSAKNMHTLKDFRIFEKNYAVQSECILSGIVVNLVLKNSNQRIS